jgi:outer membrane protein assembly factor BamB
MKPDRARPAVKLLALVAVLGFGSAVASAGSAGPTVSGSELWSARYNGPVNGADGATSVAASSDGTTVFVSGQSQGPSGNDSDYLTIAYKASTGTSLWHGRYNGPASGFDGATALAVGGGRVFVTGQSWGGSANGVDYATVAYDAATGKKLWVQRYDGPASASDFAGKVAVSGDGTKAFVTGYTDGGPTTGYDYATIAYDAATGAQLWVSRYNGPVSGSDTALSLAVKGGRVFVTGGSDSYSSYYDDFRPDYATVAYSASSGAQLWVARYNGPGDNDDEASSVAVSPDGTKVFVTGVSDNTKRYPAYPADYATVAYRAASGSQLWVSRYDGASGRTDYASSVAVSGDGTKVFVTGFSWGGSDNNYDYATIAYDASGGSQLWASRYTGPTSTATAEYASAVAANGNGTKAFVTGSSCHYTTTEYTCNYATVAYDASSGGTLWASRYNGPGNGYDAAHSLALGAGRLFVTGASWGGSATNADYATLAYQP